MEKKYFYVDDLHDYGFKLRCKLKTPTSWKFAKLEDGIYCLYNRKTGKIVMSRKHPEDGLDVNIAFAICYHKYMGWAEPKEKYSYVKVVVSKLKIGEIFYLSANPNYPFRCCGHSKNNDVLYESTKEKDNNVSRLHSNVTVFIRKKVNKADGR